MKEIEDEMHVHMVRENENTEPLLNKDNSTSDDMERQVTNEENKTNICKRLLHSIASNEALQIIGTIILLEMGDRSQISAVGLAVEYSFMVVAIAGALGHMVAILAAILFGKAVSDFTTEKCINIIGGILFLIFSAYAFVDLYYLK